ncbi:AMP-binding protein, partial [Rugosimonospora africana]|uniref:AMP-binding protein n=1 Tax=Rugosimonospora africana TaxID=556532 RepID=UPI001942F35A
ELFERQVVASPEALAVICGDQRVSYRQLAGRVNQLARLLVEAGVGPESVVALALPRSVDLVTAVLAVMTAGGAYLPIDPDYPAQRIAFMLTDATPVALLTTTDTAAGLPPHETTIMLLDDPDVQTLLDAYSEAPITDTDRTSPLLPAHPAYIIYTSGSTGQPKGAVIEHRSVVSLLQSTEDAFLFTADDAWTLYHSYAFDFSVWEVWGALAFGGRLIVPSVEVVRSPVEFARLLVAERVTVLNQTPAAFYQLEQADRELPEGQRPTALRLVIFGGEALDFGRLNSWYQRREYDAPRLVNMYGITETTVHTTLFVIDEEAVAARRRSV